MNSLKNFKLSNIFALALIFTVFACSSDDPVSEPTMAMDNTNLTTSFFTEGEAEAPTVEWNGDNGAFGLGSNIIGTSIDTNTGIISWDNSLPIGTNTIEIIATNSAGQTSMNVIVENEFSGNFDGGYNTDPNSTDLTYDFEMNFNTDGTMMTISGGSSEGLGTWTASGDTITSVYSYNGGSSYFTVVTDLVYSETEADITGFWSDGEALADPASGYLNLDIEQQ